jgi:NADH-quinone oxidoreductase subunit M
MYFSPLVYLLGTIGVIYASMTAIRQTDLKRILAYSSIAHMNLVVLGIFAFNLLGIEGAVLQSLSHGFVSGGLFFLVGVIYDRYHSRSLFYYTGLAHTMPIYTAVMLIFIMANIALPGTSSFVGEFLLLIGIFKKNIVVTVIAAVSVVLGGAYSLWLYNRIFFGNVSISYLIGHQDMDLREFSVFLPSIALIFVMGLYPQVFLDVLSTSVLFFRH